jgi:hypothetical protein
VKTLRRKMEGAISVPRGMYVAMEITIGIIIINFLTEIIGFVSMVLIIMVGVMLMMTVALLWVIILRGIIMV